MMSGPATRLLLWLTEEARRRIQARPVASHKVGIASRCFALRFSVSGSPLARADMLLLLTFFH